MDIEERAKMLAPRTMYTEEQIAYFLASYPTVDDEAALMCLEVAANPTFEVALRRLFAAGEMVRVLGGGSGAAAVGDALRQVG